MGSRTGRVVIFRCLPGDADGRSRRGGAPGATALSHGSGRAGPGVRHRRPAVECRMGLVAEQRGARPLPHRSGGVLSD